MKESKECKESKERIHLKGKRRKKGSKNKLQAKLSSYWTKNFLPFAKVPHFSFIDKKKGSNFIKLHPELMKIKSKVGITMEDYKKMYEVEDLKEVWEKFFSSQALYRELMISRTGAEYRLVYVRFLQKFEEAFRTGAFIGISRKIEEAPSKYELP